MLSTKKNNFVIDIHAHYAGSNSREHYVSRTFRNSFPFMGMLCLYGINPFDINKKKLDSILPKAITSSTMVDFVVVLAFDKIYSQKGKCEEDKVAIYTSNKIIYELSKNYQKVLFGSSIHPNRLDAIETLEKCKEWGTVLVKWLPSSQKIDPSEKRYKKFYQKIATLKIPLLCHGGIEHTIPSRAPQDFNDPLRLERALDEGVTVIIAHSALRSIPFFDKNYLDNLIALVKKAEKKNWKLYVDMSAFCMSSRIFQIPIVKKYIPYQRLLMGSDFPIPLSKISYKEIEGEGRCPKNYFDKNIWLLKRMNFHKDVFTNASSILDIPKNKIEFCL